MIRSNLTEKLGLESKLTKFLILKVGGVEEELTTKMYKFHVCSVDEKTVQVMQVVGIPQISSEVNEVDVTALANLFDLGLNQLKRKAGQIDVLIGINYSRFHLGKTKVKRTLVARMSLLGWVIFGSNAEDLMQQIKQVSLIHLSQSVDMT